LSSTCAVASLAGALRKAPAVRTCRLRVKSCTDRREVQLPLCPC